MIFRHLGLNVLELEDGPYLFLLSFGIPLAYRDKSPDALPPRLYMTDRKFSKAHTRHMNTWVKNQGGPYAIIPHDQIVRALQSISRFSTVAPPAKASSEEIAKAFELLASAARRGEIPR